MTALKLPLVRQQRGRSGSFWVGRRQMQPMSPESEVPRQLPHGNKGRPRPSRCCEPTPTTCPQLRPPSGNNPFFLCWDPWRPEHPHLCISWNPGRSRALQAGPSQPRTGLDPKDWPPQWLAALCRKPCAAHQLFRDPQTPESPSPLVATPSTTSTEALATASRQSAFCRPLAERDRFGSVAGKYQTEPNRR